MVSEYGSTIATRPGTYEPGFGLLPDTPDHKGSTESYPWRYPWRSGEALWAGFDHGSIASIEFGSMGFIDYFRLSKRPYHWCRKPTATLHRQHARWTARQRGCTLRSARP